MSTFQQFSALSIESGSNGIVSLDTKSFRDRLRREWNSNDSVKLVVLFKV